jgi:hypothetical protein
MDGPPFRDGAGKESGMQVRRLSPAQEQLWFLDQLSPGATYNSMLVWRLRGPLRVDLLHRAVHLVVARHAALRTTIRADDDGTPFQFVAPPGEVPLPVTGADEAAVPGLVAAAAAEPYDLASGPLCRFRLLRLDAGEWVFMQGFHHIVTDGWSSGVVNAELSAAYRALLAGSEPVFARRELDYPDFAEAQRQRLSGDALAEELDWWRERLAGLPVLDLPADRPRPAGGHRGATLIRDFPPDLRGVLHGLAAARRTSPFTVLAAAFALVLGRHTGSEDVPTGIPMLGRPEPELEALVGMFVNMVVLRTDLSGDPTFGELVDRVADGVLELYDHYEVSFHEVVDAVRPPRAPGRNPLFGVSVQLLGADTSGEAVDLPGIAAEFLPLPSTTSRFDLAVNVVDTGSSLRAAVEYSTDLYDEWRVAALLEHLETVLRADPDARLSRLRELLPALPGAAAAPDAPRAPRDDELRTPTERSVAGIFGAVLSRPGVGAEESFFDAGGNSLQAMRAVSRINKGFGIKLSVRTLYGNGTVRAVSAVVDETVGGRAD